MSKGFITCVIFTYLEIFSKYFGLFLKNTAFNRKSYELQDGCYVYEQFVIALTIAYCMSKR